VRRAILTVVLLCATHVALAADPPPVEATTGTGDKVRLFPNGRWEYVDVKKAEAQKPVVQAFDKKQDDEKSREQGGLFGLGRKIKPGDPDYNRGSLSGK
jgi:hypothetical protein